MSNFSQKPLVFGSLTGHRAFAVKNNMLQALYSADVFKESGNQGHCLRTKFSYISDRQRKSLGINKHVVGQKDCSCGFYAYFENTNNKHTAPGDIEAIIRGYGTTTLGRKGFRSEKADLIALVRPEPISARFKKIPRKYEYKLAKLIHHSIIILSMALGVIMILQLQLNFLALGAYLLVIFLANFLLVPLSFKLVNMVVEPPVIDFDILKQNYPNVPVFDSMEEAMDLNKLDNYEDFEKLTQIPNN